MLLTAEEKAEQKSWNDFFAGALAGSSELQSCSRWHAVADEEFSELLAQRFPSNKWRVLETGCGSGRSCIALSCRIAELHLVDFAENALRFAKRQIPEELADRAYPVLANNFSLPYPDGYFDLTRNCGVIEHYNDEQILRLATEMLRVTRPGGFIFVGAPNAWSFPVLKAALLGSGFGRRFLRFVPGYRNTTERLIAPRALRDLLLRIPGAAAETAKPVFYGSPLWSSANPVLVDFFHREFRFSRYSFVYGFFVQRRRLMEGKDEQTYQST